VLEEHFGAASRSDDDLLAAFKHGREEILKAAGEASSTPTTGIVPLGTGDFTE